MNRTVAALFVLAALALTSAAQAQDLGPAELAARAGIDQMLGAKVPAELEFVSDAGESVRLGDLMGTRPVLLALVYYECPMLCGVAMEGLISNLKVLGLEVGTDFDIVNVSIDPRETPAIAAAKKADYLARLGDDSPSVEAGWHALTGAPDAITELAETVGFRYVYLPDKDQYVHGTAIMVVTPDGALSRYYYGIDYPARDLRLGLVEAADNRIGSLTDQVLLLCYQYDPTTGKYGFVIWGAMRLAGVATVLALAGFIVISIRSERAGGSVERQ